MNIADSQKHDEQTLKIRKLAEREGVTPAAIAARLTTDTVAASSSDEKQDDK